ALVFGGIIGGATLLQGGTAEAGHAHFSGSVHVGGGVRASGGVHVTGGAQFSGRVGWSSGVHFARPVWHRPWYGGRISVGGGYSRPYYYYYSPSPDYVPSYSGGPYSPAHPSAAPGFAPVPPPPPPRPAPPTFGIGVFAGGSSVQDTV